MLRTKAEDCAIVLLRTVINQQGARQCLFARLLDAFGIDRFNRFSIAGRFIAVKATSNGGDQTPVR